ncbi:hypothetical protein ARNL5_00506 [Anaerolineae bacterium]|nr:hypothetical protein ARNL5_00506 [Anaerolineae bacterium]
MIWNDTEIRQLLLGQQIGLNRSVSIDVWLNYLAEQHLHCNPDGEEILRVLGGLIVVPKHGEGCMYYGDDLHFDPTRLDVGDAQDIESWEANLGCNLMPIGIVLRELVPIVIDDEGRIYCIVGNIAYSSGDDLNGSLRGLLLADRIPVVLDFPHDV